MSDYEDAEGVLSLYAHQTEKEINELGKTIVALRAKIRLLEISLEKEQERVLQEKENVLKEKEKVKRLPIPPSIVAQIASMTDALSLKDEEIEYYKKYVQPTVIINRLSKETEKRRSGGLGSRANTQDIKVFDEEIDFYTNYVQTPVIINKKPKEPVSTRKGGLDK